MSVRQLFLLLVASFAQAASSAPWAIIMEAQNLSEKQLIALGLELEDMAIAFVSWKIHRGQQPAWCP